MTPALPKQDLDHVVLHTADLWPDLAGASVFFTGATGFVGSWLLESLLHASDERGFVVDVHVLTRDVARFQARMPHLARDPRVTLQAGDARGIEPRRSFSHLVHAATASMSTATVADPLASYGHDVDATRRVLEFAGACGVRRMLFTSSGAVYGTQPPTLERVPEDFAGAPSAIDLARTYGNAKRASESMCALYATALGIDVMIARLFAFVGPRLPLDAHYAVGNFIRDAVCGSGKIEVSGDGTPRRSYLYAADLAIWLWTILLRGRSVYPYNVGSSEEISIYDLACTAATVLAPRAKVVVAKREPSGAIPARYVPDIARSRELGLQVRIPLQDSLRRTGAWLGHDAAATDGSSNLSS